MKKLIFGLVLCLMLSFSSFVMAQQVKLKLVVPTNSSIAVVTDAVLYKDTVMVGEFNGFLAASGGSSTGSIEVSEEPNSAEICFRIPWSGTPTIYSISDLSFDTNYYLQDPSPGGMVVPILDGSDAYIVFSLISDDGVIIDSQAPSCTITSEGGIIEAVIQDEESGIAEIEIRSDMNVTVDIPDFPYGTNEPVIVTAEIDDTSRSVSLALKSIDVAGNRSYCKHYERRTTRSYNRSSHFEW